MAVNPLGSTYTAKRCEREADSPCIPGEAIEKTRKVFTEVHPITGLPIPKGLHRRTRKGTEPPPLEKKGFGKY